MLAPPVDNSGPVATDDHWAMRIAERMTAMYDDDNMEAEFRAMCEGDDWQDRRRDLPRGFPESILRFGGGRERHGIGDSAGAAPVRGDGADAPGARIVSRSLRKRIRQDPPETLPVPGTPATTPAHTEPRHGAGTAAADARPIEGEASTPLPVLHEGTTAEQLSGTAVPGQPRLLGPAALIGAAGEFVRIVGPHTEAHLAALLLSFLVAVGNLFGRKRYFVVEATRHYCNTFVVLVGPSAKARKGTSAGYVRAVTRVCDPAWDASRVTPGLATGEGLIKEVANRTDDTDGEEDRRLFVHEGEFGQVLRVAKRKENILSTILRSAWDTGDLATLTKTSPLKVTGAHISILGHITSIELQQEVDLNALANGLLNRMLWVWVVRERLLPDGGRLPADALAPVHQALHRARAFAQTEGELTRDGAARELWRRIYPALSADKPGLLGSVTARAEAHVLRLSCIYALLDCSDQVKVRHLEAALEVWRYCEESARFIFGESLGDPLAEEVLAFLRERGKRGATRSEMGKIGGRHHSRARMTRALNLLAQFSLATSKKDAPSGGRPAERWIVTEVE